MNSNYTLTQNADNYTSRSSSSSLIHASKTNPCPICNHPDWCYGFTDSSLFVCQRHDIAPDGWFKTKKVDRDEKPFFAPLDGKYRRVSGNDTNTNPSSPSKANDLPSSERDRAYRVISDLLGDLDTDCFTELNRRDYKKLLSLTTIDIIRNNCWVLPWSQGIEVPESIPENLSGISHTTNKTASYNGLAIAAVNLAGKITGYQNRPHDEKVRSERGKYLPLSGGSGSSWHLPNGEQPITCWQYCHFTGKPELVKRVIAIEGFLKSLLAALLLWKAGLTDIAVIGVPGCKFGSFKQQLLEAKEYFEDAEWFLAPDAGSISNLAVLNGYTELYKLFPELKVLWWNQYRKLKVGDDLDDNLLAGVDFSSIISLDWNQSPIGVKANTYCTNSKSTNSANPSHKEIVYRNSKVYTPDSNLITHLRYLDWGKDEYNAILPDKVENVIIATKAYYAEGKTELMKTIVNIADSMGISVFIPGSRNNLGIQTSKRIPQVYQIRHDLELEQQDVYFNNDLTHLAFCIDALINVSDRNLENKIVILDEIVGLIDYSHKSATLENKRKIVLAKLTHLLTHARLIYLFDANLTDDVVASTSRLSGNKFKVIKIENEFYHKERMNLILYTNDINSGDNESSSKGKKNNRNPLTSRILNGLNPTNSSIDKTLIMTDSLSEAEETNRLIQAQAIKDRPIKGLVISSETAKNPLVLKLLECNNREAWQQFMREEQLDYIIGTPSIESGLSIDLYEYFDQMYCLFFGVVSIDTAFQMMQRLRDKQVPRHIWVNKIGISDDLKYKHHSTSGDVRDDRKYSFLLAAGDDEESIERIFNLIRSGTFGSDFSEESAKRVLIDNYEKLHYSDLFRERARNDRNIDYREELLGEDGALGELRQQDRKDEQEFRLINLEKASTITERQYKELKRLPVKDDADKAAIEKYDITREFPDIDKTPAWSMEPIASKGKKKPEIPLERIASKSVRNQVKRLWALDHLEQAEVIDRQRFHQDLDGRYHTDVKTALAYRAQMEQMGILDLIANHNTKSTAVTEHSEIIKKVMLQARKNIQTSSLGFYWEGTGSFIQWLNYRLSLIGFKLTEDRTKREGEGQRSYYITRLESAAHNYLYESYDRSMRTLYPHLFPASASPKTVENEVKNSTTEKSAESLTPTSGEGASAYGENTIQSQSMLTHFYRSSGGVDPNDPGAAAIGEATADENTLQSEVSSTMTATTKEQTSERSENTPTTNEVSQHIHSYQQTQQQHPHHHTASHGDVLNAHGGEAEIYSNSDANLLNRLKVALAARYRDAIEQLDELITQFGEAVVKATAVKLPAMDRDRLNRYCFG